MVDPRVHQTNGAPVRTARRALRLLRLRRHQPPGTPPGTVVSPPMAERSTVTLHGYDETDFQEMVLLDLDALPGPDSPWSHHWINVDGLADAEVIQKIGRHYGIHPLALEDVVGTHQRSKVESYDDLLYVVLKMITHRETTEVEQVSLFIGPRFVLSFQEHRGDCLDVIRERLRKGSGRLRSGGSDYLAYALIDAIVDHYFPVLEALGERLESIEQEILTDPNPGAVTETHAIRRELLGLRRAAWPLREAMSTLCRDEHPLITPATRVYLRDCYDHTVQLIDLIETYRELAAGLIEIYLSSLSQKNNEVMKVLTIIATIFIPLSFIAGVYGMNFDPGRSPWNMPELSWTYGYPFALGLMILTVGGLLTYFARRGWLTEDRRSRRRDASRRRGPE